MKLLQRIWDDIRQGENIDMYLTIAGALILSAVSLAGIAVGEKIAGVTLAVLALLAINTLVNRHKLDKILEQQTGREWFFQEYPPSVNEDIENAKELWLVGYHLIRTMMNRAATFEAKLARNEKIKILILDPESEVTQYANESLYYPMSLEQFKGRIHDSLGAIRQFSREHPENVEVRLSSQPIPFGAYAMNIEQPKGIMYLELYKYKAKAEEPHFILRKKDTPWFDLYHDQLLSLWKDAKPINVAQQGR